MITILQGDWIDQMHTLPDASVHCCVTSPPYWGLRDYGVSGQLGLEKTPEEYVSKLVSGFREVKRLLRDDGTLWLNLGDSYNANGRDGHGTRQGFKQGTNRASANGYDKNRPTAPDLKRKDLVGIPWRVAFALQADGWFLRSDIIWHKPNPMPESVTDRPTKAHEYIFLMSKSQRYFYDAEAIKEELQQSSIARAEYSFDASRERMNKSRINGSDYMKAEQLVPKSGLRNKRTVWTVATSPYSGAHFATFPPDLIKPCIFAGCPVGGTVLDPFGGSGTTGKVAIEHGRKSILIELNPDYVELIKNRTNVTPGFNLK